MASSGAGRATAVPNSRMFSSPMPASQSRPAAPYGATPASDAAARQRSGSSAAQASACGPPPDQPAVRNGPASRWSSTAAVSAAASATVRPGCGVDRP